MEGKVSTSEGKGEREDAGRGETEGNCENSGENEEGRVEGEWSGGSSRFGNLFNKRRRK